MISREIGSSSNVTEDYTINRIVFGQEVINIEVAVGPCCFYNLEILFDPGMKLDVLTSLKTLAKGRELYVDWPGEWKAEEQCLTFAEPNDPVYRAYPVDAEVGVVDLSGETYPALEF